MNQAILAGVTQYGLLVVLSLCLKINVVLAALLTACIKLCPTILVQIVLKYVLPLSVQVVPCTHFELSFTALISLPQSPSLSSTALLELLPFSTSK